jgi:hypothetical protein
MPSFDPFEIQRLDDEARRETRSAEQDRPLPRDRARHRSGLDDRRTCCEVIEIASFQPKSIRRRGETI